MELKDLVKQALEQTQKEVVEAKDTQIEKGEELKDKTSGINDPFLKKELPPTSDEEHNECDHSSWSSITNHLREIRNSIDAILIICGFKEDNL